MRVRATVAVGVISVLCALALTAAVSAARRSGASGPRRSGASTARRSGASTARRSGASAARRSGASAARRSGRVVCGPAHANTLASDRAARVYTHGGNVYGCAQAGHQSFRLGTVSNSTSEGRAGPVNLAGTDVAYGLTYYGVDTISADVVVRSLTNGAVLRRRDSWSGSVSAEYFQRVDAVVLKNDGSVAWTATAGSFISSGSTNNEVVKSDRTSRTLLDKSKQIKVHSLMLNGSQLSWQDGSASRHATLK